MGRAFSATKEDREEIVRLFLLGVNQSEIARRLDVTRNIVTYQIRLIRSKNIAHMTSEEAVNASKSHFYSREELAEAYDLFSKGYSFSLIEESTGINGDSFRSIVRRAGISRKVRPVHKPNAGAMKSKYSKKTINAALLAYGLGEYTKEIAKRTGMTIEAIGYHARKHGMKRGDAGKVIRPSERTRKAYDRYMAGLDMQKASVDAGMHPQALSNWIAAHNMATRKRLSSVDYTALQKYAIGVNSTEIVEESDTINSTAYLRSCAYKYRISRPTKNGSLRDAEIIFDRLQVLGPTPHYLPLALYDAYGVEDSLAKAMKRYSTPKEVIHRDPILVPVSAPRRKSSG